MYIKNHKNFLPQDYIDKFNIKQSKKFLQGFIFLIICNLIVFIINLNLKKDHIKYTNSIKLINNEELKDESEKKKSNILNLKNILQNNNLIDLVIKDNKFTFKVKEEELKIAIDTINEIGQIEQLTYLNEENFIQAEGRIR